MAKKATKKSTKKAAQGAARKANKKAPRHQDKAPAKKAAKKKAAVKPMSLEHEGFEGFCELVTSGTGQVRYLAISQLECDHLGGKWIPSKAVAKKAMKKKAAPAKPPLINTVALARELETSNTVSFTDGKAVGACLIIHPGSGRVDCRQYTENQCNAIGGEWIGSPCN